MRLAWPDSRTAFADLSPFVAGAGAIWCLADQGIVRGYAPPAAGDKLIRLVDHTVMPGLMDMHTHLQSQHSKDAYTERFFMDEADYALPNAGSCRENASTTSQPS